jgi:hypothetical protein
MSGKKCDTRAEYWSKAIKLKPGTAEHAEYGMERLMEENIELMNQIEGFDVVIVCTSTPNQAKFWQQRLESTLGSICPSSCKICAVDEDWGAGGAGNGLGTLYAFQKASALAKQKYKLDILKGMTHSNLSVGMYHTAGKGTRLAPIPGAENNNKPGVKLPAVVSTTEGPLPLTILEGVIKQTGVYASSRKGRLSVFWGDQVFIPSAGVRYQSQYHADILAQMGPMPSKAEWESQGYSNYGLIATGASGEGAQVEKVTFEQASELLKGLGEVTECGPSLGSFSVSQWLLGSLMKEFKDELHAKCVALDSDPHFWMPMTLPLADYVKIMGTKKMSEDDATAHFARLQKVKNSLPKVLMTFGAVGVGKCGYWWDYGQVKFYQDNNMILTRDDKEARAMRKFFGCTENYTNGSTIINSSLGSTTGAKSSVVVGVNTKSANLSNALMVNVTAPSITGTNCVAYNVVSETPLNLKSGDVLVGMQTPGGEYMIMKSNVIRDGKDDWKTRHSGNPMSYEEIYAANSTADPKSIEQIYQQLHQAQNSRQSGK